MNGTIIPGTPIAVDFWKIRECSSAKVFFLTHLHGDHIVGLTSSWQHDIHCSPLTGKLLTQMYGIQECLIKPLEVEMSHIINLDDTDHEKMTVTVLDANHCPGSVMFLFDGYFGRILYTGDFRYHGSMIDVSKKALFSNIDVLYLDNTYCSPDCVFPTRESALNDIMSVISSHPQFSIVIGMRNLGKEDMLVEIALRSKEWISVPASMLQRINLLNLPNVFCVQNENCRIRVVKFQAVSKKNMELWNKIEPTIAILPTALYQGLDFNCYGNMKNVYTVQYSDHSSYPELVDFVTKVRPKKIIPVVSKNARGPFGVDISDRANMECFSHLLRKDDYCIPLLPESVLRWKPKICTTQSVKDSNCKMFGLSRQRKKSKSFTRGVVFTDSDIDEGDIDEEEVYECSSQETLSHCQTSGVGVQTKARVTKKRKRCIVKVLNDNVNRDQRISPQSDLTQKHKTVMNQSLLNKWFSVEPKEKQQLEREVHRNNKDKICSNNASYSKDSGTQLCMSPSVSERGVEYKGNNVTGTEQPVDKVNHKLCSRQNDAFILNCDVKSVRCKNLTQTENGAVSDMKSNLLSDNICATCCSCQENCTYSLGRLDTCREGQTNVLCSTDLEQKIVCNISPRNMRKLKHSFDLSPEKSEHSLSVFKGLQKFSVKPVNVLKKKPIRQEESFTNSKPSKLFSVVPLDL